MELPAANTTAAPIADPPAAGPYAPPSATAAGPAAAPVAHPAPRVLAPVAGAPAAQTTQPVRTSFPAGTPFPAHRADLAPTGALPAATTALPMPTPIGWSVPAMDGHRLLAYANSPIAFAAPDSTSRRSENHGSTPAPVKHGAGRPSPAPPPAPPGSAGAAGSGAAGGGGASTALFCAILVTLLAYPVQELRRHRFRLVLAGPIGVVFPQQRPG